MLRIRFKVAKVIATDPDVRAAHRHGDLQQCAALLERLLDLDPTARSPVIETGWLRVVDPSLRLYAFRPLRQPFDTAPRAVLYLVARQDPSGAVCTLVSAVPIEAWVGSEPAWDRVAALRARSHLAGR